MDGGDDCVHGNAENAAARCRCVLATFKLQPRARLLVGIDHHDFVHVMVGVEVEILPAGVVWGEDLDDYGANRDPARPTWVSRDRPTDSVARRAASTSASRLMPVS